MRRAGGVGLGFALTAVVLAPLARAQECRTLRYAFQPDCYRASASASCDKRKTGDRPESARLDMGPQIAVWLESADGGQLVDTLMVTSLVASRGLGNRPGHWQLPSSPRFPYGKRPMALPVWAHRRGRLYDTVVMQDKSDKEWWLGFHEAYSSPDPYYCRPMTFAEIDVDAVTCPTAVFNSAKGRLGAGEPRSYYPPRNDLVAFTDRDCDDPSAAGCSPTRMSARRFADLNDLDAVAAATPPYGRPHRGVWTVPAGLADGDYAVFVEVSKEFDNNAHHGAAARAEYLAYQDPHLADSGLRNNFGQPSVVFRVPIRINRGLLQQAAVTEIAGYGDWKGASGTLHPADQTISDAPGSGQGRLLVFTEPAAAGSGAPLVGRVHVVSEPRRDCIGVVGGAVRGLEVPPEAVGATEAEVRFLEADDGGLVVEQYEVRFREGRSMTAESFADGTPGPALVPARPGQRVTFKIAPLKPQTQYVIGVRARGCCIGVSPLAVATFTTAEREFTRLSGCFVATAAYGSAMEDSVATLRRLRDRAVRAGGGLAAAAVAIYERASPPLAAALRESEGARALARAALTPIARALETAEKVGTSR